jgi:hypothetical protein
MIASTVASTVFAGGEFRPAASAETLPVVEPATGRTVGAISAGGAPDVDRAVRSASADITAAVRYFEFYSGGADNRHGDTIPYLPATRCRCSACRSA